MAWGHFWRDKGTKHGLMEDGEGGRGCYYVFVLHLLPIHARDKDDNVLRNAALWVGGWGGITNIFQIC